MGHPSAQVTDAYLEALKAADPMLAENKRRERERRQIFERTFAGEDGQAALQIILAIGGVTKRSEVFPNDTGMMLAERSGRRFLALEILDLSGAALALEPYRAPPEDRAAPGPSGEPGGRDGQSQT